jgi:hypothetical protein
MLEMVVLKLAATYLYILYMALRVWHTHKLVQVETLFMRSIYDLYAMA